MMSEQTQMRLTGAQTPQRWWQWILLYPTLIVTIIPAIFQFIQWGTALHYGLPLTENTTGALDQLNGWKDNAKCITDRNISHVEPKSPVDYKISLLPCPSGDILVTLTPMRNPDDQVNTWVLTRKFFGESHQGLLVSSALAQSTMSQVHRPDAVRVIGIKQQGTTIIKRTQLSDGTCIDTVIDGLTGRQLSGRAAPSCNPP
jgi:hypothetical protein